MPICSNCGSGSFEEDTARGDTVCRDCGNVLAQNTIVAEVKLLLYYCEYINTVVAVLLVLLIFNSTCRGTFASNSSMVVVVVVFSLISRGCLARYHCGN